MKKDCKKFQRCFRLSKCSRKRIGGEKERGVDKEEGRNGCREYNDTVVNRIINVEAVAV